MVDIHVRADGLRAEDAVKLVTEPLETIVKSIPGVEHVYSQTQDDGALVTARFEVGTSSDAAIVRVHEKVRANMDRIPKGIPEPLIVGRGIDDVAIKVLTLAPRPEAADRWTPADLTRVAHEVQVAIAALPEIGLTYIVGETPEEIRIRPDPERLAQAGLTLQALAGKVEGANRSFSVGTLREDGRQIGLIGRPDADRPDRDREPSGHHARRPPRLCARRGRCDACHRHDRGARLPDLTAPGRVSRACPPCRWPSPSAPAPMP